MNLEIKEPGRLGNFLFRIKNALHIALHYNYNIILPAHPFINTTYIVINKSVTINDTIITDKYNFFNGYAIQNIDAHVFDTNTDTVIKMMKDVFIINNIPSLGNDDLVIHMRSGDIFKSKPHPIYLMPPLSYYVNIIEMGHYNNIYLLAEDTRNPCINQLIELYPSIIFKLRPLEEDVKIILSAVNIAMSFGTFISALLTLSTNKKMVYCPSYYVYEYSDSITHVTDLAEYHKIMIPWKNTKNQREIMLTYPQKINTLSI